MRKNSKWLILLLVLSLMMPVGWPGIAPVPTAHAEGGSFTTDVMFEAEDGVIVAPWQIQANGTASGGSYVATPPGTVKREEPIADPDLLYTITIPETKTYNVWVRVLTPTAGSDSLYMAYNDDAYTIFNFGPDEDWKWVKVKTAVFSAGDLEMKWQYREPRGWVDRFLITQYLNYVPTGLGEDPTGNPPVEIPEWDNPYPEPSILPPDSHPRLFVREDDLPAIRSNLDKGLVKEAWDRVLSEAQKRSSGLLPTVSSGSNFSKPIRAAIEANALIYLLGDNRQTEGRKAIDMAKEFASTLHVPNTVSDYTRQRGTAILLLSVVYDWCYNLLTNEEKQQFIEYMVTLAEGMEIGFPPTLQGAVTGHGSEAQLMRDLLAAGIAVYDEEPQIYELVAGRFFSEYIDPRNFAYPSHSQHQGDSYGQYRFQWDMFATWIFHRMQGVDGDGQTVSGNVFDDEQQYTLYRYLYTRRPDGQLMRDGDTFQVTVPFEGYWLEPTAPMMAASYYGDPVLNGEFLRTYEYKAATLENIWIVLFHDPDLAATDESGLPLTKYFDYPYGAMTARTGWAGGEQSNTVIADMKVGGKYFANHQHLDAGQFQLYYKGGLAIDSGIYNGTQGQYNSPHDKNYYKRTIAHNSMLVYDPDEVFEYKGSVSNDGGQRFPNTGREMSTLEQLTEEYDVAQVLGHKFGPDAETPDFSYLKGDLTDAYTDKVADFKRSFVFLNLKNNDHPGALIVYDHVTSADPAFKKTWLLHSVEEPQVVGQTTTIARTTSGYNGKLVNETLLPGAGDAQLVKVGGPGNEFLVGDTNYTQSIAGDNQSEAGAWRVEISPAAPDATDRFLNVMQVMDNAGGPQPLETVGLDSDDMVGVQIDNRAVWFSKSGEALSGSVSFELNEPGEKRVLVTDLAAGYWTVSRNGAAATQQYEVAADDGTLYFTGEAGSYELVRADERTLPEPSALQTLPLAEPVDTYEVYLYDVQLPLEPGELRWQGDAFALPRERLLQPLGVQAEVDGSTITLSKRGKTAVLTAGSDTALIDGEPVALGMAASLEQGVWYIPLDALSQAGWIEYSAETFFRRLFIKPSAGENQYYPVKSVTAGSGASGAALSLDDRDHTAWMSADEQDAWIRYDLGRMYPLERIGLSWYEGEGRHYRYQIEASQDGTNWTVVYDGESGGAVQEEVWLAQTPARYVRLTGSGYASADGLSTLTALAEIRFYRPGLPIEGVLSSSSDGNMDQYTIDNDLGTRWSAEGVGEWIRFDLGAPRVVTSIAPAWYNGHIRRAFYSMEVSADGAAWQEVYRGESSGTSQEPEEIVLADPATVKYVRITGYGNSANSEWNSLTEVYVYGYAPGSGDKRIEELDVSLDAEGQLTIEGTLDAPAGSSVTVSVYRVDGSGSGNGNGNSNGEPEAALHSEAVSTDAQGAFTLTYAASSEEPGLLRIAASGEGIANPQTRTIAIGAMTNRLADLQQLLVNGVQWEGLHEGQTSGNWTVGETITLQPVARHAGAAITINDVPVASGSVYGPVALSGDEGEFVIRVRSDDGRQERQYMVTASKTGTGTEDEAGATLEASASAVQPGQELELTIGASGVLTAFTALEVLVSYDPDVLEFETVQVGDTRMLAESALQSLLADYGIAGAMSAEGDQIMIVMFTTEEHVLPETVSLFKLHGQVKEDADAGQETEVSLSEFELSFEGGAAQLVTGQATASIQIVGELADKTALAAAIASAEAVHLNAQIGTEPGQYTEAAKLALFNAIQSAETVYEQVYASQVAVGQATVALNMAIQQFIQSAAPAPEAADKTALIAKLAQAEAVYGNAQTGNKIGQYPAAAKAGLNQAIAVAQGVRDYAGASQAGVDAQTATLETALQTFASTIVTLVEGQSRVTIRDLSLAAKYFGITSDHPDWDRVAAADLNGVGEITIEVLAGIARMILDDWAAGR